MKNGILIAGMSIKNNMKKLNYYSKSQADEFKEFELKIGEEFYVTSGVKSKLKKVDIQEGQEIISSGLTETGWIVRFVFEDNSKLYPFDFGKLNGFNIQEASLRSV